MVEEFKKSSLQATFDGLEVSQPTVFDITKFPLKDLERFKGLEGENKEFRWPADSR